MKRLVRRDRVFDPRRLGHDRRGAIGDQDGLGGHALVVDGHRVRIHQAPRSHVQIDTRIGEQPQVDLIQAVDFLVLVGDQPRPTEVARTHRPAVMLGVLEVLVKVGAVDQQFLWNAAADNAGAADAVVIAHRHLGAVARGDAARADAPRSGADDKQIIVVTGHCRAPAC